jgi:hypothetical protein
MKKRILHFLILMLLIINQAKAQTSFKFEVKTEEYKSLTESIPVYNSNMPQTILANPIVVPLGFTFVLNDVSYKTVNVSIGALLGLMGDSIMSNNQAKNNIEIGADAPLGSPSVTTQSDSSEINYKLIDSEGFKVAVFEFKNAFVEDDENEGTDYSDEFFDVQFWFFEQDYSIEVRYGSNNFSQENPMIKGPLINYISKATFNSNADLFRKIDWLINLGGSPENPEVNISTNTDDLIFLNTFAKEGTSYRYSKITSGLLSESFSNTFQLTIDGNNMIISGKQHINAISIFNLNGQLIETAPINSNEVYYPINGIASGVYLLHIESKRGSFATKFVK